MSTIDFKSKQVDTTVARKMIASIMRTSPGNAVISSHAKTQMMARKMTMIDVMNLLHGPSSKIFDKGEFKDGSYRYQYGTPKMGIAIAFWPNGKGLNVCTAFRR